MSTVYWQFLWLSFQTGRLFARKWRASYFLVRRPCIYPFVCDCVCPFVCISARYPYSLRTNLIFCKTARLGLFFSLIQSFLTDISPKTFLKRMFLLQKLYLFLSQLCTWLMSIFWYGPFICMLRPFYHSNSLSDMVPYT